MATPKPEAGTSSLVAELARVLPADTEFAVHHISTPPTITEPLCYPPAYPHAQGGGGSIQHVNRARKPLKTYCEKHFLAVSIYAPESKEQVLALALEINIYTTAHSSILFVSKADSTGYLGLLKLPSGTPSPIREVTTTFIAHLVANRRRKGTQFIVNLFARSQSQYLFPGSVKNSGKHILDDRGLVKWWCRVLNPLLGETNPDRRKWNSIHGYLVIPGLDDYETRVFLPRDANAAQHWTLGHPLHRISPYLSDAVTYGSSIPIRCLIPTYPDDPKARFVEELEESTSEKAKLAGGWKSPRTLDQFWEMMAYRQECSSGRLTGFIWLVLDPLLPSPGTGSTAQDAGIMTQKPSSSVDDTSKPSVNSRRLLTPEPSQGKLESTPSPVSLRATPRKVKSTKPKIKKVLKGRIVPRQPKIKTQQRAHFPKNITTAYYFWPEEGRGQVVLDESGYTRAVELLLHLEFATLEQAVTSTARWIKEVDFGKEWSLRIVGKRSRPVQSASIGSAEAVNDLSSMVKKKRPAADEPERGSPVINTLGTGLVRKKVKITSEASTSLLTGEQATVNTLGAGLVRKKPKPT